MQVVGDELSALALGRCGTTDFDLLSRSAFNRYYYATYLVTRNTIGQMVNDWKGTNHSGLPILLEVTLIKKVKLYLDQQLKGELIDKGQYSRTLSDFRRVGSELAQLLKYAYHVRVLADYEPEVEISYIDRVIILQSCKITTAKSWSQQAERLCGRLLKLWKGIGLG
ncbi:hypothetical protein [Acinetobacter sp. SEK570]|uniref:hypothetical protein n=1 Tax=unclassified Acinetobacter TaxID=196816 RepID=UPI0039A03576